MNLAAFKRAKCSAVIYITYTLLHCLCTYDLDWNISVQTIPLSYFNISTSNILRCGKLCERQGKCAAVTYDTQNGRCYMHREIAWNDRGMYAMNRNGHYLFKNYSANPLHHASTSTCDIHTQIIVPSARDDMGTCANMKGLIGHSCTKSTDCIVSNSECRLDGVCGCPSNLVFHPSNQTCGTGCNEYGTTFHVFKGMVTIGHDIIWLAGISSPEACKQKCLDEISCSAFEMRHSDSHCLLNHKSGFEVPDEVVPNADHDFYQRDCS